MTYITLTRPARRSGLWSLVSFATKAAALRRQRSALARLNDTALKDIGLTRAQAQQEASRMMWDVPQTWRD